MNEFLLAIHRDTTNKDTMPSQDDMEAALGPYQEWLAGIATANKLVGTPKHLDPDGRYIQRGNAVATSAPGERIVPIGGLFVIRADDYNEAVEIAKSCPVIQFGAVVEVRMAMPV